MGFANVPYEAPLALWFWEEVGQPRQYMGRWGMPGWRWLG